MTLEEIKQKAIEYAKQKHKEEYDDPAFQRDVAGTKIDFVRGYTAALVEQAKMPSEEEKHITPDIITICGSGRFLKEMHEVEERMTLNGIIVLMIGVNTKDVARIEDLSHYKPMLDELHLRKIDISDGIFVVNPGGYIGESTAKEIAYAKKIGKPIQYLEGNRMNSSEKPNSCKEGGRK